MKKVILLSVFCLSIILILSLSTISIDWFNWVTGKTTKLKCNDSDGGKDYYVRGVVVDYQGAHTDVCMRDGGLKEYYCGEEQIMSEFYNCSCSDGVCLEEIEKIEAAKEELVPESEAESTSLLKKIIDWFKRLV